MKVKKELFMSSLCIKTNNEKILTYLQNEFSSFNMLNTFYSCSLFRNLLDLCKKNKQDKCILKYYE